jgi:predicted Co/Zn/Cd cation transporter (cation efflux family)
MKIGLVSREMATTLGNAGVVAYLPAHRCGPTANRLTDSGIIDLYVVIGATAEKWFVTPLPVEEVKAALRDIRHVTEEEKAAADYVLRELEAEHG